MALNKTRVLAGVVDYNALPGDGSITATLQSNPLSYALSITSPRFTEGTAGVNAPKAFPFGTRLVVNSFSSYSCSYTTPGNVSATDLLTAVVQDGSSGLYVGAEGTTGSQTFSGGVFNLLIGTSGFIANGFTPGASVLLGDIVFSGGSDTQAESITLSNFAINGSNGVSVADGHLVFDTQIDNRFNYEQPPQ
jgi:hypothetical protein